MDRLTTSQIADFINPLAFARQRDSRIGQTAIGQAGASGPIRTQDIEASFRLITGASERLETLEGNLQTMLELANSARFVGDNLLKEQEIYGKLRSLSAGFDQVVDAIQFDKKTVFTGDTVYLDLGNGVRPMELDVAKLKTYGEDSLNLSLSEETAKIDISYSTSDQILNETYDIFGLDIEAASYVQGSNPALELETGTYKVQISYAGPDSTVEIRSNEGAIIERKEGVDLSGSGREWVDFDSGVRLSFEKDSFFSSFDKYDYETNGPAQLVATMNYERVEAHTLRTEEGPPDSQNVNLLYSPSVSDGTGSLSVSGTSVSPVDATKQALKSGAYIVDVEYRGSDSIVKVTDGLGRLKAFETGVDLSAEGSHELDLGLGFTINLEKDQLATNGMQLSIPLTYTQRGDDLDDFDFREYARRIQEAIEIVQEQREIVAGASERILEVNQLRNSATTSGIPDIATLNSSGALSMLSGGGSLFTPMSSDARFRVLSEQLFASTTALPTQANQSPQELAALQSNASTGGWLGTFA